MKFRSLGTRVVFWSQVALAIGAVLFLGVWYSADRVSLYAGDGSLFLLLGFGIYFSSFPVLLSVLTPLLDLSALRNAGRTPAFWVSFATLLAFNSWASLQLYWLAREGV